MYIYIYIYIYMSYRILHIWFYYIDVYNIYIYRERERAYTYSISMHIITTHYVLSQLPPEEEGGRWSRYRTSCPRSSRGSAIRRCRGPTTRLASCPHPPSGSRQRVIWCHELLQVPKCAAISHLDYSLSLDSETSRHGTFSVLGEARRTRLIALCWLSLWRLRDLVDCGYDGAPAGLACQTHNCATHCAVHHYVPIYAVQRTPYKIQPTNQYMIATMCSILHAICAIVCYVAYLMRPTCALQTTGLYTPHYMIYSAVRCILSAGFACRHVGDNVSHRARLAIDVLPLRGKLVVPVHQGVKPPPIYAVCNVYVRISYMVYCIYTRYMYVCMYVCMYVWMNEWMNEWMNHMARIYIYI